MYSTVINVSLMEMFALTVIREIILRRTVQIIEKLHEIGKTETESPSADKYEFVLNTINLHKNCKLG